MRFVYFNPAGDLGGGERSLLDVMASMREAEASADIHVVVATDGPFIPAARRIGADVTLLPMPRELLEIGESDLRESGRLPATVSMIGRAASAGAATWRYVKTLRRTFMNLDPTLVHTNGNKCHLLACLAGVRGIPVVWHLRDFLGLRPVMPRVLRCVSGRAAGAIAISRAVGEDARACLAGLPIEVIYNAIDTTHFTPAPRDGRLLDELSGLPAAAEEIIRVGLVATFAHWKGHDVFLKAASRLLAAPMRKPVRFYIIGGSLYYTPGSQVTEESLRATAAALKVDQAVGFIGFQTGIVDLYRSLDIVVHASIQPEPFGRTIVEAMACSKPVLVSRAGGAVELFTDDRDAIGFPPGDSDALAASLRCLVNEPERMRRIGERARQTAVERFSRPRLGREIAAFYRRLLPAVDKPTRSC